MRLSDAYNFRQISDHVLTSGILTRRQLENLAQAGIEMVINLLPDDNKSAVAGEQDIVESQGIRYAHIPVDFAAPQVADYQQFKRQMADASNQRLLIHCAANYRVSAFYSQYAQDTGLWDEQEASAFVHSIWNPAEYPGWTEFLAEISGAD